MLIVEQQNSKRLIIKSGIVNRLIILTFNPEENKDLFSDEDNPLNRLMK